jgi:ATP-dependent exoDNAse (exonuclease V) alpha subunit
LLQDKHIKPCVINADNNYYAQKPWRVIRDTDDFADTVNTIKNSNESWNVGGRAGTGKTHLANMLQEALPNSITLAPTNKAARLVKGKTIHKFLGLNFNKMTVNKGIYKVLKKYKYLIIDEASMISEKIYHILDVIKYKCKCKIILVGDFDQLPPIENDDFQEHEPFDYQQSEIVKSLCDFNQVRLTKNRRSDNIMWDIQSRVLCDQDVSKEFPQCTAKTFKSLNIFKHLCYTNRTRKYINELCMERYIELHPDLPVFELKTGIVRHDEEKKANCQDLRLCKGMPMIAHINRKNMDGLTNNKEFIIEDITAELVTLKNEAHTISVPLDQLMATFYVAFCLTIHRAQGSTFNEPHVIWAWDEFPTDIGKALKYVAVSRTTKKDHIYFGNFA